MLQGGLEDYIYIQAIYMQTLCGLEYMHKRMILHGDFNPHNVLYSTTERRAQIVDFGFSEHFGVERFKPRWKVYGTVGFRAPEIALFTSEDLTRVEDLVRPAIDLFAWGCMVLYGLNKERAFATKDGTGCIERLRHWSCSLGYRKQKVRNWCDARGTWKEHWGKLLTNDLREFLLIVLHPKPLQRVSYRIYLC